MKLISRFNLQSRVIFVSITFAIISAIIYLILTTVIVKKLESTMLETVVSHEIDELVVELATDPDAILPKTASVSAYLLSRDHLEPIPDEIKFLSINSYSEIRIADRIYQAKIVAFNDDQLYVIFDVTDVSRYLSLLLIMLISGGVISVFLLIVFIIWFFRKHLSPISSLAKDVANLNPNEPDVRMGSKYRGYEVGLIAHSIDQFMDRLDDFVEREQSFTAAVSHELRTPVSVISTAMELLELKNVTRDQQVVIDRVKSSTRYIHNVIETLLFFARDTQNVAQKTLPEIGLNEIFIGVLKLHEAQAAQKKLELRFTENSNAKVRMVENHLEIILGNLVQNAINHTDQGEVKVILFETGFSVEDTGKGINPDDIQHIVKRNYHDPSNSGNGLGLYLVERICEAYKFKLEIESEVGKGSKFSIIYD